MTCNFLLTSIIFQAVNTQSAINQNALVALALGIFSQKRVKLFSLSIIYCGLYYGHKFYT